MIKYKYTIVEPIFISKKYDKIIIIDIDAYVKEFNYYMNNICVATYIINLENNVIIDKFTNKLIFDYDTNDLIVDYNQYIGHKKFLNKLNS